MSLAGASAWSAVRAAIVVLLALPAAWCMLRAWQRSSDTPLTRWQRAIAGLALVPLLTPSVITGYAYGDFALSLIHHPRLNESLYTLLLALRLAPAAGLVLLLAPAPPLTGQAAHCLGMARGRWVRIHAVVRHGAGRPLLFAAAVVFLLAFQDFELATLLGVSSWTVQLFDAQVGGLPLSRTLVMGLLPTSVQLILVALVLAAVMRTSNAAAGSFAQSLPLPTRNSWLMLCAGWLLTAGLAVTAMPLAIVGREAAPGLAAIASNFTISRELAAAVGYSFLASLLATLLAAIVRRRRLSGWALLLCVPGLAGSLVVGLVILYLFQKITLLQPIYDSPVPLTLALVLLLLPFTMLLMHLLARAGSDPSLHAAKLLAASRAAGLVRLGRQLQWDLHQQRYFWIVAMAFCVAFFDLTASSLLAPSGTTPVFVRLYNLMHYGRSSILSALVLAAMLTPALCIAGGLVVRAICRQWVVRG